MKAKRLLVMFLALALVLCTAACGGGKAEEQPAQSSNESAAANQETAPAGNTEQAATEAANAKNEFNQGTEGTSEEDKYGGELVTCRSVNPTCLFYPYMYASSQKYCFPAIETLGRYNLETNHYEPFLCESWERDNEALTLTLKLKQGIKFHDGSDFNAESVKWEFEYMIENGNGNLIGNPAGFEVVDDYTLKIQFSNFALDWEDVIAATPIYSQKEFEDNGLAWCLNNIVGTGPFVMKEYVADSYMTFERNENYWQEGLPYLDSVKHQIIPDWAGEMTAFDQGTIDWFVCGDISTADSLFAMGYDNGAVETVDGGTVFGVYPNSMIEGDPFYDVRVRQAVLLYGVDWDAVTFQAKGKYGFTSLQGITDGALGYSADVEKESYYDVEKAKALLAEAGYENGFDTKIITANYGVPAATALQDQLKAIGINAEIEEIATSDGRRYDGSTPGLYINSGNTTYDYGKQLQRQYSYIGQMNKMCNFSEEYNAVCDSVFSAQDYESKAASIQQAIHMLSVDECLYRVMFIQPNILFLNDRVIDSGLETNNYYTPEIAWIDKNAG